MDANLLKTFALIGQGAAIIQGAVEELLASATPEELAAAGIVAAPAAPDCEGGCQHPKAVIANRRTGEMVCPDCDEVFSRK